MCVYRIKPFTNNVTGHAGAMLQARQLGKELYVGVHSDEEILFNKGPVVMKLAERMAAVEACKWSTQAIASAPYVTDPKVMEEYGCKYVVHGDDITTDANGEDCYQTVKDLGLFVVVKRTPNILTTDLVGRMLLMTTTHHIKSFDSVKIPQEHLLLLSESHLEKFQQYATDATGLKAGSGVYVYSTKSPLKELIAPSLEQAKTYKENGIFYIDGGFDLFHPGHIEALRLVKEEAKKIGAAVIVGIHDDHTVNTEKGLNYPIMNLFERSLCVLQCRYVDGVVLGAPYVPEPSYLATLPGTTKAIYHGLPSITDSNGNDPYEAAKQEKLFKSIGPHEYDSINTEFIVNRVLGNKAAFEERQRRKGWKADIETKLREAEKSREQLSK